MSLLNCSCLPLRDGQGLSSNVEGLKEVWILPRREKNEEEKREELEKKERGGKREKNEGENKRVGNE